MFWYLEVDEMRGTDLLNNQHGTANTHDAHLQTLKPDWAAEQAIAHELD